MSKRDKLIKKILNKPGSIEITLEEVYNILKIMKYSDGNGTKHEKYCRSNYPTIVFKKENIVNVGCHKTIRDILQNLIDTKDITYKK